MEDLITPQGRLSVTLTSNEICGVFCFLEMLKEWFMYEYHQDIIKHYMGRQRKGKSFGHQEEDGEDEDTMSDENAFCEKPMTRPHTTICNEIGAL